MHLGILDLVIYTSPTRQRGKSLDFAWHAGWSEGTNNPGLTVSELLFLGSSYACSAAGIGFRTTACSFIVGNAVLSDVAAKSHS